MGAEPHDQANEPTTNEPTTNEPTTNEQDRGWVPPIAASFYGGFGETLAQAFEFAVIPVLFGVLGLWLDGRLGTRPWLTVVLLVVGITGVVARAIYVYKARVEAEEEGKPWTRRRR